MGILFRGWFGNLWKVEKKQGRLGLARPKPVFAEVDGRTSVAIGMSFFEPRNGDRVEPLD